MTGQPRAPEPWRCLPSGAVTLDLWSGCTLELEQAGASDHWSLTFQGPGVIPSQAIIGGSDGEPPVALAWSIAKAWLGQRRKHFEGLEDEMERMEESHEGLRGTGS